MGRLRTSAYQNQRRVVVKAKSPVQGIVGFITGLVGFGILHGYFLNPISWEHPFDAFGHNVFVTDAGIGIAMILFGCWFILARGFNFVTALVLSSGLSIVAFWAMEFLAWMG